MLRWGHLLFNCLSHALRLFLIHQLIVDLFILSLLITEFLVLEKLIIGPSWLRRGIIEDSLTIDDVLELANNLIKRLAILIIFSLLIDHDLANRDREATDELSRETLEDLVEDAACH